MTQDQIYKLREALEGQNACFGMQVHDSTDDAKQKDDMHWLTMWERGSDLSVPMIPEHILASIFVAVLSLDFVIAWGVGITNEKPNISFR